MHLFRGLAALTHGYHRGGPAGLSLSPMTLFGFSLRLSRAAGGRPRWGHQMNRQSK